ncbi:hypothetical protein P9369_21475, partial [Escherichia coli]
MSRPDWGALQQEYIAEYTRSGISPVAWCEARGLNYATARRYIKKTPKNAQTEMCKTAQKSAQKKSAQTAQKRNEKSQEKKPVFDAGLNEGDAEEFSGNDSNLLIVFYVQIMPDDFVMQLHR